MLGAGSLVAFLQLCRVYGQALAQIAEAEVRLFHLYVHEPLIREGVPGLEMAEEMEDLASDLLPFASPMMDYVHQRFLQHFVEQDVVGYMESELEDEDVDLGACAWRSRSRTSPATRASPRRRRGGGALVGRAVRGGGHQHAPRGRPRGQDDRRRGDGRRPGRQGAGGLGCRVCELFDERPEPRIGVHWGTTLYRDGDYFGRDVNLTSRVVARARGGEVLVTDSVVDAVSDSGHLSFEGIAAVKLKGFDEPWRLCRAIPRAE